MYSQNDPRWKNVILGFNTGPTDTIGNYGCYVTAIADVCQWAGNDKTPQEINDICKQNGWFVNGGLISRDDIPAQLCGNLTYQGRTNWSDATSMNFFADASDPNVAYIILIDASHAPGLQSHFVMVWAKLGDNDLEINDSWDGIRKPLSSYGNPSVIIYSAMKFTKTAPPEPTPPPPPPVVVPEPVVVPPPPPPSPVTITPPATASNTQPYSLVTTVPSYPSPGNALNRTNSNGTLANGSYYIYNQQQGMYSLTKDLGVPKGTWINPADNTVTPKPVAKVETEGDIQASWHWFFANHEPVEYKVLQDIVVSDQLHASPSVRIPAGKNIYIYGSFKKAGKTYLRPLTSTDAKGMYPFYGIPTTDIYSGAPYLDNEFNIVDIVSSKWESLYDKVYKTIEGIFRVKKK